MKTIFFALFLLSFSIGFCQKTITYDEMKTITKGAFETIECDIYVGKDGHSYKVGDTLKVGRPSSNKTFAFITMGGALSGEATPVAVSSSGTNTIIKRFAVGGTKKAGFTMYVIGKGACAFCGNYTINFEQAIEIGEIQSLGLTREQAIAKLKEAKELVDLGMMSNEDYEKLKTELTPIIMKN